MSAEAEEEYRRVGMELFCLIEAKHTAKFAGKITGMLLDPVDGCGVGTCDTLTKPEEASTLQALVREALEVLVACGMAPTEELEKVPKLCAEAA